MLQMCSAEILLSSLLHKYVGGTQPCLIVAEIGQNHQGDLNTAKQLIQVAKDCGADCVKFQKSDLSEKFNKAALEQPYESIHSWGRTYGEHKAFLEFTYEQFIDLQAFAKQTGILCTASAMDKISLKFLDELGVPFIKIGSGDADNSLLLKDAASTYRPLFISTGMQDMTSVKKIYRTVKDVHSKFALLHCVSSYPTPPDEINLQVLRTYQKCFPDIVIGYSGHEVGYAVSTAAVALGAKILERHITLDKNLKGSDHRSSLEPSEFKKMVSDIRTVESALGNPVKRFQPSEEYCYKKLGKSLVAAQNIQKDTVLNEEMINIKVAIPKGIPAGQLHVFIGRTINKTIYFDETITENDFY